MSGTTFETIPQGLELACSTWQDRKALTFLRRGCVETVLTYGQLRVEAAAFAARLKKAGISRNDRVVLFFNKSVDAVVAYLALQASAAVAVPLNPGFKAAEMRYLLDDAQARLVLCDMDRRDWLRQIDAAVDILELPTQMPYVTRSEAKANLEPIGTAPVGPSDPGLIVYTSGTTGHPKGAVLTQANLACDAANVIDSWEISPADTICHALPLYHVHGLSFALHTALLSGAHTLLLDAFDPDIVVNLLANPKGEQVCTVFMAVPTMYAKLIDRLQNASPGNLNFSHLRLLTCGSAPLLPREFDRIVTWFGQAPVEREGMTETGMNFSNPLHSQKKPGSIGLPLPGVQVRIVDPQTHKEVGLGDIGEIRLKSPAITPGYWRKAAETAEAFVDGWFRTGDLGRKDADGYYYITDRIKHIIISGGENVSAKEVESVINSIEGVVESSVVGLPDAKWGERVAAAVVLKPGITLSEEAVRSYCKARLHDWKCPRQIIVLADLPRNSMGKVMKEEVQKALLRHPRGSVPAV